MGSRDEMRLRAPFFSLLLILIVRLSDEKGGEAGE